MEFIYGHDTVDQVRQKLLISARVDQHGGYVRQDGVSRIIERLKAR